MSSKEQPASKIGAMAQATSAGSDSTGNRRRSSSGQFSSIMNHKRGSQDAAAEARKASFAEQTKPPGFIAGLWNSAVKGNK